MLTGPLYQGSFGGVDARCALRDAIGFGVFDVRIGRECPGDRVRFAGREPPRERDDIAAGGKPHDRCDADVVRLRRHGERRSDDTGVGAQRAGRCLRHALQPAPGIALPQRAVAELHHDALGRGPPGGRRIERADDRCRRAWRLRRERRRQQADGGCERAQRHAAEQSGCLHGGSSLGRVRGRSGSAGFHEPARELPAGITGRHHQPKPTPAPTEFSPPSENAPPKLKVARSLSARW